MQKDIPRAGDEKVSKEKVRFVQVYPENKWLFSLSWNNREQSIEGIPDEIEILIPSKTEEEAKKKFYLFIEAIKERGVLLE